MTTPSTVPDQVAPAAGTATAPITSYSLVGRVVAEALGTFLLVFAGLGIALFNQSANGIPIGLGFGLAMLAGIIAFGHISGGYFNPAVSLGLAIVGKLKWLDMVAYWVAQVVGATIGALVLFAIVKVLPGLTSGTSKMSTTDVFNSLANGYGSHSSTTIPVIGALLIEAVATAIFVAVILASTSPRNRNSVMSPVAIGLTLGVLLTVALPLTNGSMNPARSTAVVFFSAGWASQQLWLFWVAPLLGGAIAALFYRVFKPASEVGVVAVLPVGPGEFDDEDDADEDQVVAPAAAPVLPQPIPASTKDAQDFFDGPDTEKK